MAKQRLSLCLFPQASLVFLQASAPWFSLWCRRPFAEPLGPRGGPGRRGGAHSAQIQSSVETWEEWSLRLPRGLSGKEPTHQAGDVGSIPGSERSSGEGNGYPLQYSLENPMDRGAWLALVHGVSKRWTWLKWLSTHTHALTHTLTHTHTHAHTHSGTHLGYFGTPPCYRGEVTKLGLHLWQKLQRKWTPRLSWRTGHSV